jgi:DNA repair protein RadC
VREAIIDYQPKIHELPLEERPRERLQESGAGALRNPELLAILLRVGGNGENAVRMGERIIAEFGGIGRIAGATFAELCAVKGVGPAKASQLLAGIELGRRIVSAAPDERRTIRCSNDIVRYCHAGMVDLAQEEIWVLLLDARNRVLRHHTAYQGNAHTAVVRVAELFREAVRDNASAVVIVHNHPSGDPSPSQQDVDLTTRLVEAGDMLDVEILDHIVIARGGYASLKEEGMWPAEKRREHRAAG